MAKNESVSTFKSNFVRMLGDARVIPEPLK